MPTVIFDFDSTLIRCESLEEILRTQLLNRPDDREKIEAITKAGMEGKIDFHTSLQQRLDIAQPSRQEVQEFSREVQKWLTPGVEDLVRTLEKNGVEVWIISGGLQEVLEAASDYLGINKEKVHGVQLLWSDEGKYQGIDESKAFSQSKVKGVQALEIKWHGPCILVGDGMTDYALFKEKMVDHFIAFTQYARRQALVEVAPREASDVQQLQLYIKEYL
ncbi:MAG: phosphoserine phosphatase [Waddliaceae bacterium]|nr:phosphoserine phosphatase [Waddliaceae bacterium]